MKSNQAAGWILLIGITAIGFAGFLPLAKGPATSESQRWFRVGLFPAGLVLIGVAFALKKRGERFFGEK